MSVKVLKTVSFVIGSTPDDPSILGKIFAEIRSMNKIPFALVINQEIDRETLENFRCITCQELIISVMKAELESYNLVIKGCTIVLKDNVLTACMDFEGAEEPVVETLEYLWAGDITAVLKRSIKKYAEGVKSL